MKEAVERTIKVPVLWMMYGEIELDIQTDENADEEEILTKFSMSFMTIIRIFLYLKVIIYRILSS